MNEPTQEEVAANEEMEEGVLFDLPTHEPDPLDWKVTHSEQIDKIGGALAKAQGQMHNATKDAKSHHGKYADLAAVIDASRPALTANGLAMTQPTIVDRRSGIMYLVTILLHDSGQWLRGEMMVEAIPDGRVNANQALGSALSYLRRYGYQGIAGVAAEDDDGNSSGQKGQAAGQASRKPPQQQAQPEGNGQKPTGNGQEPDPKLVLAWSELATHFVLVYGEKANKVLAQLKQEFKVEYLERLNPEKMREVIKRVTQIGVDWKVEKEAAEQPPQETEAANE